MEVISTNMSQDYIEITERTVSEAITAACQKLAVPSERLEYEVIDPGKSGFLGIGARAAKIRARVKKGMEESTEIDTTAIISDVLKGKNEKKKQHKDAEKKEGKKKAAPSEKKNAPAAATAEPQPAAKAAAPASDETAPVSGDKTLTEKAEAAETAPAEKKNPREASERNQERGERAPRERGRHRRQRRSDRENAGAGRAAEAPSAPRKKRAAPVLTDDQISEIVQRADTFLKDVLGAMDLDAEIVSSYDKENGILTVEMNGDNMGVLIGKRGQTLDSLQYLVSLVVNKGVEGYIHVKADTENYRERRKKTLENLAKNIAGKVKRNHTSVVLEPMNPYERRIIHSALQGDRYVTTYSEGEEPYRKVIVTMKEDR